MVEEGWTRSGKALGRTTLLTQYKDTSGIGKRDIEAGRLQDSGVRLVSTIVRGKHILLTEYTSLTNPLSRAYGNGTATITPRPNL